MSNIGRVGQRLSGWIGGIAQVKHLPSIHEALGSIPSTNEEKKKNK
jgi:hypothetical protein